MISLVLSHFDMIFGPKVILKSDEQINRDILEQIPKFLSFQSQGFFIHIFKGVQSANYVFELINANNLRGGCDSFLITILISDGVINPDLSTELLKRFIQDLKEITNVCNAFDPNAEEHQVKQDQVINLFFSHYNSMNSAISVLKKAELRYQNLFEAAREAIIIFNRDDFKILAVNKQAEILLQQSRDKIISSSLAAFQELDSNKTLVLEILNRVKSGKNFPIESILINSKGIKVPVEIIVSEIEMGGQDLIQCMIRDITDRIILEQRKRVRQTTIEVLAESPSLDKAIPKILKAICKSLNWVWGEFWVIDPEITSLRCESLWHEPSFDFPIFEKATWEIDFPHGIGLPGQAWKSHKPQWITDVTIDPLFLRAADAVKDGLHGAFAFPIFIKNQLEGVMAFFTQIIADEDENLLLMFAEIGSQIGWFIERKKYEKFLQESRQELLEALEKSEQKYDRIKKLRNKNSKSHL